MKKIVFILFCFFLSSFSYAQINLIGNPSFEIVDPAVPCTQTGSGSFTEWSAYWLHEYPWTCPAQKNICFDFQGVGTADWNCSGGHTGDHYGFTAYLEYIFAHLQNTASMVVGHVYYIEYWVKGSEVRHNSGIKFFEDRPKQCGGSQITGDGAADVGIWDPISNSAWTKVSMYYTALHPYNWIGLGSFKAEDDSGPSYSFDDISIIEVGSSSCPDVNYIQNTTFQNIGKITFPSQNLTIAGNNIASAIAQGNVVIGSTAIVEFKSAKQVILEPGFSVEEGAYFEAYIAPCDADCFPAIANAGADAISCGNQTVQLGTSLEENITYLWSANPSAALAYLSNPNSSNPIFTPPASGNGRIVYILTATNSCATSVTDNVIITYDANPSNSPTVSVSNINYSEMIEFDASFGSQTEQLIVEVYTTAGSLVNTYTYNLGVDFNCCTYHWKIPASISPCTDYVIKVKTKNICSSVLSAEYVINWARNRNLSLIQVGNYITPSQSWCFTFTGGVQYHVTITNPSGVPVYDNTGTIAPPYACVWNGECNQPACSQPEVTDGTYYYILTITGCDGSTVTKPGFITVLINGRELNSEITDTTENTITANGLISSSKVENNQIKTEIYPNPNAGSFTIKFTGTSDQKTVNKIVIYDAMGTIIQKTEILNEAITIDISSQAKGMYFVKIENEQGVKVEKIIYQ